MPQAPAPLISLHQLSMHYLLGSTRIDVLRDVTLDIASGQTVAVAGPSGSGKTSLLLLLAGLERPGAGSVSLGGRRLDTMDSDALADLRRDRIGIVFQSFHLLPSLSALDNVALPLQIAGHRDALPRARAQLDRVGLGGRLTHYPSQLSGGEQQRVAIARALVHRPELLLADEPTGNLDDHTGALIRELLFELHRDSGTTMVLVTHDLSFAARCDRVLHLHDGQLHEGIPGQGRVAEPGHMPGNGQAASGHLPSGPDAPPHASPHASHKPPPTPPHHAVSL
jgi:putative ABC transport system ATP-binding protein